jgi:hypothetical protein
MIPALDTDNTLRTLRKLVFYSLTSLNAVVKCITPNHPRILLRSSRRWQVTRIPHIFFTIALEKTIGTSQ